MDAQGYLAKVKSRLDAAGYTWIPDAPGFRAVATRKGFQPTKFGMWEDFFWGAAYYRGFRKQIAALLSP